ncbi:MlaC/ttg2D family ABC transporter substrate-binding protein [Microvirga puerhi]|uniref:ABC transporter substrate-binding protein n=1 Tax=Microvirga puerhi TaxID=2876078 RepID=A0ABS7VR09_9HYPH|nr:ABC transporter substrate-binding protein [Microvirga puerhi]MBZ6077991.1 ABC transporter substrate-binding protein [Microvirga puerhi]
MFSRRQLLMLAGAAVAYPCFVVGQERNPSVTRIKEFYEKLQAAADQPDREPKERLSTLSGLFMEMFDTPTMTRIAVGPSWPKLPEVKKASLQDAFGQYVIALYSGRLGQAAGGRFEVLPDTERRAGGILVRTRITDAQGNVTPVDYLMNGEGRIVDIYLKGTVSELASQRPVFERALKAGGPDRLEAELRERTQALRRGQ